MRAIAFDLDGTLLNSDHLLSEANQGMIEQLNKRGVRVILASGRTHLSMLPYYQILKLTTPMICYNGAKIVYPSGEVIEHRLKPLTVQKLMQFSQEHQIHLNLYHNEVWYTERPTSQEALRYAQTAGLEPVSEGYQFLAQSGVTKALFIATPDRLAKIRQPLEEMLGDQVTLTSSMSSFLEVLKAGVHKAQALRVVLQDLEIAPEEAIAFGDGLNDYEMIEAVGHGVAMQNAHPLLIKIADAVAPHHHPDGVTRYLNSYLPHLFT